MDDNGLSRRFGTLLNSPELEEASLIKFLRRFSIFKQDQVNVQERESIINGVRIRCVGSNAMDIAGRAGTADDGKRTLRLSEFLCKGTYQFFEDPISFVATPHSNSPVYLTTRVTLPDPPDDVIVEVSTWDSTGAPAPSIGFSWRCWAATYVVIE